MKDKIKTILIIIIFSLILAVSLVMILDRKDPNDKDLIDVENEYINSTNTYNENTINENQIEENNTVDENTTSNVIGREEKESEEESKKSSGNNDQKAIELVKKEWGDDESSVYFNIENKNGTKYKITVRSSETTEAIAWYDVDVETEKVTSN